MRVVVLGQAIIHDAVAWPEALHGLTGGADAVICNFEGCLPPVGAWPMKTKTVHPMHPRALEMLGDLGVTHLGLANNHAWDFGHVGLVETRARVDAAGFAAAGVGRDLDAAWAPAIRNGVALIALDAGPTPGWAVAGQGPGVAALEMRASLGLPRSEIDRLLALSEATGDAERRRRRQAVGFDAPEAAPRPFGLSVAPSEVPCDVLRPDLTALDRVGRAISAARAGADIVIVALHYHHWAPDWLSVPDWIGPLAEGLIAAGADAVVGTGPPWALDVLRTGTRLVAPGLGNLVFHTDRAATYDRLCLPVWDGLAGVLEKGRWATHAVAAVRPPA